MDENMQFNPFSRYKEHTEVYGLTLYDIYRQPRCLTATPIEGEEEEGDKEGGISSTVAAVTLADTDALKDTSSTIRQSPTKTIVTSEDVFSDTKESVATRATNSNNKIATVKNEKTEVAASMKELNSLFQCPICLGYMKKTFIVMECLHRFCGECIQKCLRIGKKECPSCRVHIPSRRSLRPDYGFDLIIRNVYDGINITALEDREAKEIEAFNKERNMNNAYAESRKRGIMQQTFARRKLNKTTKSTTASSSTTSSTTTQQEPSSSSRRQNTKNNNSEHERNGQQPPTSTVPTTTKIRINNVEEYYSPLMDFVLRRHAKEKIVDKLRREWIRTSEEIKIGQIKKFLGQKLNYQPWSHFQILTLIGGKLVALDDSIKLGHVFAIVCEASNNTNTRSTGNNNNDADTRLLFQYRIQSLY